LDRLGGNIAFKGTSLAKVNKVNDEFWRVPFNQFTDSMSSASPLHTPITITGQTLFMCSN
jgi:hypothetical protein